MYFYILKHLPTSRVTLITLIAPVLSVLWGYLLPDERWQFSSAVGVGLLLSALCLYQWHRGPDKAIKSLFNGSLTKAIQKTLRKTS